VGDGVGDGFSVGVGAAVGVVVGAAGVETAVGDGTAVAPWIGMTGVLWPLHAVSSIAAAKLPSNARTIMPIMPSRGLEHATFRGMPSTTSLLQPQVGHERLGKAERACLAV
jgi:hypothetical protein